MSPSFNKNKLVGHPSVLLLEPIYGLANRMEFVDSAIALSKKLELDLQILWFLDPTLNCRLENLYVIPQSISRVINIRLGLFSRFFRKILRAYFSRAYDFCAGPQQIKELLTQHFNFEELGGCRRIYLWGYRQFYPPAIPFSDLVPTKALQSIIDSYGVGNRAVGVHIRRTDFKLSDFYSQTSWFISAMKKEMQQDPSTVFFVASDSPAEEDRMRREFPDRIIVHRKRSYDRNNPLAAQDALIDLYCLSKCRKLIGSYDSSFSEMAWQIRGIDKNINTNP
jgi:hypothetical protein